MFAYTGFNSIGTISQRYYNNFSPFTSHSAINNKPSYGGYGKNNSLFLNDRAKNFVIDAKANASTLLSSLSSLTGKDRKIESAFDKKNVKSSDENIVKAYSYDNKKLKKNTSDTKITVNQLAKTQKNESTSLTSNSKNLSNGNYTFNVKVKDKNHQLSISVSTSDNNKSIQEKVANAINKKDIGVKASISYTSTNTSLSIESRETGKETGNADKFTITDISGTAVSQLGLQNKTQSNDDAKYTENGIIKSSKTNDAIKLDNGMEIYLKSASASEITLTAETDRTAIKNGITNTINNYNKLLESSAKNYGDTKTYNLFNEIKRTANTYKYSLEKAGINIQKDGKLSVDNTKLEKAVENGSLERLFKTDTSYGFAGRLENIGKKVAANPMNYVGKESYDKYDASYLTGGGYFQPYDYGRGMFAAYSQMSKYSSVGMLFDSFF